MRVDLIAQALREYFHYTSYSDGIALTDEESRIFNTVWSPSDLCAVAAKTAVGLDKCGFVLRSFRGVSCNSFGHRVLTQARRCA